MKMFTATASKVLPKEEPVPFIFQIYELFEKFIFFVGSKIYAVVSSIPVWGPIVYRAIESCVFFLWNKVFNNILFFPWKHVNTLFTDAGEIHRKVFAICSWVSITYVIVKIYLYYSSKSKSTWGFEAWRLSAVFAMITIPSFYHQSTLLNFFVGYNPSWSPIYYQGTLSIAHLFLYLAIINLTPLRVFAFSNTYSLILQGMVKRLRQMKAALTRMGLKLGRMPQPSIPGSREKVKIAASPNLATQKSSTSQVQVAAAVTTVRSKKKSSSKPVYPRAGASSKNISSPEPRSASSRILDKEVSIEFSAESIYVIECLSGKYYVGRTHNKERRWKDHLAGTDWSAEWTKIHRPIKMLEPQLKSARLVWDGCEDSAEREETLSRMATHGIDNVRGSDWTRLKLEDDDLYAIKNALAGRYSLCRKCMKGGHMISICRNSNMDAAGLFAFRFDDQKRIKSKPSTTKLPSPKGEGFTW